MTLHCSLMVRKNTSVSYILWSHLCLKVDSETLWAERSCKVLWITFALWTLLSNFKIILYLDSWIAGKSSRQKYHIVRDFVSSKGANRMDPGSFHSHRTIEWFWLEGIFDDHLVQPSCHGQGHLLLDQAAQCPIQPGLDHFQWWGIHNFSGQPLSWIISSLHVS